MNPGHTIDYRVTATWIDEVVALLIQRVLRDSPYLADRMDPDHEVKSVAPGVIDVRIRFAGGFCPFMVARHAMPRGFTYATIPARYHQAEPYRILHRARWFRWVVEQNQAAARPT